MAKDTKTVKEMIALAEKESETPRDISWVAKMKERFGDHIVEDDRISLESHSYDTWPVATKWKNQGKVVYSPDVIVNATSAEQISEILQWATENKVPVTPWGGGSSVTGQGLPTKGGIIIDTTEMTKIEMLDDKNLIVKAQAGLFGHLLEEEMNKRGYTLNHSPQSLDRSTIGGWVATRAMGQLSSRYGGIEDLMVSYTAVLPNGEIVEMMNVPRAAVGPDLRHILMGAEGTLGIITDVTLKIFPKVEDRIYEAITFNSVEDGVEVMRLITRNCLKPSIVRFYDVEEARHAMQDKSFDKCVMFLAFEGVEAVAAAEYDAAMALCAEKGGEKIGPAPVEAWMGRRYDFSTVEDLLNSKGGLAETIEIANYWNGIMDTYNGLKKALAPYAAEVLGHFSHVYTQGTSLYIILLGQEENDEIAEQKMLEIWDTAMQVCIETGAAIAHHHGSGLARLPYVEDCLGNGLDLYRMIKKGVDPAGIMNPGKMDL